MPLSTSELIESLQAVRDGKSDGQEFGFMPNTVEALRLMPDVNYDAIGNLYRMLIEQSSLASVPPLCVHLSVVLSNTMGAENLCSTLSELRISARHEPDVQFDGARLFYRRGQKYFAQQDFDKAKNYFRRATEIAPHFREAWLALAGTYELLGMSEQATEAFARAKTGASRRASD